jgi:hypothetical protein
VFAGFSRVHADQFIRKLVVGDNLSARDPIYLCRERLRRSAAIDSLGRPRSN